MQNRVFVTQIPCEITENSLKGTQGPIYKNSHRPNAKAFGASGSQVTPDSSARPAGPGLFSVYC